MNVGVSPFVWYFIVLASSCYCPSLDVYQFVHLSVWRTAWLGLCRKLWRMKAWLENALANFCLDFDSNLLLLINLLCLASGLVAPSERLLWWSTWTICQFTGFCLFKHVFHKYPVDRGFKFGLLIVCVLCPCLFG